MGATPELPEEAAEHVRVLREKRWWDAEGNPKAHADDELRAAVDALVAMLPPEFTDEECERYWIIVSGDGNSPDYSRFMGRKFLTRLAAAGGRVVWDD